MVVPVGAPVVGSVGWSTAVTLLPWATLFVLLVGLRTSAWRASLVALSVGLAVAVAAFGMPVGQALDAAAEGAAFGLFPIMWTVVNALWVFQLTVASGHFPALRRCLATISRDQRVQAVLLAFCVGALLEGLVGFGASVALCAVLLVGVGLRPLRAASVVLVASTAPVAVGAAATPAPMLTRAGDLADLPWWALVAQPTVVIAVVVPVVVVAMVDGRRGLRQAWPVALTAGAGFAGVQYALTDLGHAPVADIAAAAVSGTAVVVLVRLRPPPRITSAVGIPVPALAAGRTGVAAPGREVTTVWPESTHSDGGAGVLAPEGPAADRTGSSGSAFPPGPEVRGQVGRALSPYLIIVAIFVVAQVPVVATTLRSPTITWHWPGLHVLDAAGRTPATATFTLDWLATPGTLLLVAGLVSTATLGLSPRRALLAYRATLARLGTAIITVAAVVALGYVLVLSGQTLTLGRALVSAGAAAVSVTMISTQNLVIAASAVGLPGAEGHLLRRVIPVAILVLLGLCLLLAMQATILGWTEGPPWLRRG